MPSLGVKTDGHYVAYFSTVVGRAGRTRSPWPKLGGDGDLAELCMVRAKLRRYCQWCSEALEFRRFPQGMGREPEWPGVGISTTIRNSNRRRNTAPPGADDIRAKPYGDPPQSSGPPHLAEPVRAR